MKKLLTLILLPVFLLAFELGDKTSPIIKKYFNESGDNSTLTIFKINNDPHFKKIDTILTKQLKSMGSRDAKKEDLEVKWIDILMLAVKSVEEHDNPVSAYVGRHVLLTRFPAIHDHKYYERIFADSLYKNAKSFCDSYIAQGKVYEKGLLKFARYDKAIEVYKEALDNNYCKVPWKKRLLEAKIFNLQSKSYKIIRASEKVREEFLLRYKAAKEQLEYENSLR